MCSLVGGSPLDILRFPSVLEYHLVSSWVGNPGQLALCEEDTLLSSSHSEEGRNEVLQAQGEFPVHWQKEKSALVSMATQLHGSH